MRHTSGSNGRKSSRAAAACASSTNAGGIGGHGLPLSGSIRSYRYPVRSLTHPASPQLVIATDIVKPPGGTRCRNGALAVSHELTAFPQCSGALGSKPAQQGRAGRQNLVPFHPRFVIEQIEIQTDSPSI